MYVADTRTTTESAGPGSHPGRLASLPVPVTASRTMTRAAVRVTDRVLDGVLDGVLDIVMDTAR
ncbi:hypothetical protein [Protofrankia symbiont of Coriaria ruscifolia]|uniref:hypothetical protein n=1 Tax=Protofrankia symbiont of Coriaria ruscifolia TaxID=1306542 RepID=UPI0010416E42|nr:hypothetical protein [Protofrankia symbiont of Coriaria ruscifolia]